MVVILKVGGLAAAADCIRAHIAHDARPWKLVHVSTLNQARLALARERVDLLLIHHQLPDGDALSAELPVAGVLQLVSIDPGFESVAAQALDQGFTDYVVEATHDGFGAVMLAQISSALRHRETTRTLHRQHGLLSAISRAQASFIQTNDNRAAFNSLLTDLLALTHSAYGFVGEVFYDSPEAPWLQVHALTNLAWDEASRKAYADADGPGMAFRKLDTLFGSALRTGEPVLTNAPAADPRAGGTPQGHPPLLAFLGIPVGPKGQLLAMVGLANRPGGYSVHQIDLLRPLLDTIGQMVVARRMEAQRAQALHVLNTTLNSMDQGLLMTDDLNMQALSGDLGARTALSMAAGCDIALHCKGDLAEMQAVAEAAGAMTPAALSRAAAALAQRRAPEAVDIAALEAEFSDLMQSDLGQPNG